MVRGSFLTTVLLAGFIGGAFAQSASPPLPDRRIEYQVEDMRLSVPLNFHHPLHWDDPPKGSTFRPYLRSVDVVLMWPNLSDATDPASQRCIARMMAEGCRELVRIGIDGRDERAEQQRRTLKETARPSPVGMLHGFEVARQTTPIPPASRDRVANVYVRIAGADMGDPGKIEGYCGGLWREVVPEALPEIERQMLICLFRYNVSDKVAVSISTFAAPGLPRWKQLLTRVDGLLQDWQKAAR